MSLIEQIGDLSPESIGVLAAAAVVLVALATSVQLSVAQRRRELARVSHEVVDEKTGLLPRSAIPVRLGAELSWAVAGGTPFSVVAMRLRGAGFVRAASVLREAMRDEEQAYLLGDDRVVVHLWDAGPREAALAVDRFAAALAAAGSDVVDAGVACAPRDGDEADELVAAAVAQMRPVDDQPAAADDSPPLPGALTRLVRSALGTTPWFAAMSLLLFVCWRLLPAVFEPRLDTLSGSELVAPIGGAAVLVFAAALLFTTCWNFGGGALPRSRPAMRAGWRTAVAVGAALAGLLALGLAEPDLMGNGGRSTLGAALAVVMLVVLALMQARQLVHVPSVVLVVISAAGAAVVVASVEAFDLPVVANAGRLLFAAAVGAVLARAVERPSWLVVLSLLIAGVDIWSVYSGSGITNQLLESDGEQAGRVLELLFFLGPHVHGGPLFVLGTTDLVFLALFLAWAHDWRMDMRAVVPVLTLAACGALVASAVLAAGEHDEVVPVLPVLAFGMVLLVALRWGRLARRGRRAAPR